MHSVVSNEVGEAMCCVSHGYRASISVDVFLSCNATIANSPHILALCNLFSICIILFIE